MEGRFNIQDILAQIPEDHSDRETAILALLLRETANLSREVEKLTEEMEG